MRSRHNTLSPLQTSLLPAIYILSVLTLWLCHGYTIHFCYSLTGYMIKINVPTKSTTFEAAEKRADTTMAITHLVQNEVSQFRGKLHDCEDRAEVELANSRTSS